MPEPNENPSPTVPEQPEAKPPVRKTMPIIIALVVIMGLIGIANLSSLLKGNKKSAPAGTVPVTRPAAPNAQQVNSFETQQQLQAERDAQERQHEQEIAAAMQQLEVAEGIPGPEGASAPPMTAAQRAAIYGESPNAPVLTSDASQELAEAKQRELAKEKQHQNAIDSDTEAIDFEHPSAASPATTAEATHETAGDAASGAASASPVGSPPVSQQSKSGADPMAPYSFDQYQGRLYRIFEGTILEGVVTNHIDGGFSGPVLVMLTTDYYSHNHQQLLMPQTPLNAMKNANVRNIFGETNGMTVALNTNSPAASSTAWTAATVPVNGTTPTYLAGQTPGSTQLSELAMIEASDSVSPDCLTAVGQYRAARTQNAAANNSLASEQLDGSTATNSEVEQLNLLNAGEMQRMSEMQSQGGLQACLASEMAVSNMQQRNAAAMDLNTAAYVAQQRSADDTSAANEGNTWDSYLP